jgi:hypothetical protein
MLPSKMRARWLFLARKKPLDCVVSVNTGIENVVTIFSLDATGLLANSSSLHQEIHTRAVDIGGRGLLHKQLAFCLAPSGNVYLEEISVARNPDSSLP